MSFRLIALFLIVFAFDSFAAKGLHVLPNAKEPIQVPEGCYGKGDFPCAMMCKKGEKFKYDGNLYQVTLDEKSQVVVDGKGFTLVDGMVLVENGGDISIETLFGVIDVQAGSRFLISQNASRVRVRMIFGQLVVKARGHQENISITEGFENWFGAFDVSQGFSRLGIPQPINWNDLISDWGRIFPGTVKDFRRELYNLHPSWQEAIQWSSRQKKKMALRYIASVEEDRRKQAKRRKAIEAEKAHFRRLFRQKNYLD